MSSVRAAEAERHLIDSLTVLLDDQGLAQVVATELESFLKPIARPSLIGQPWKENSKDWQGYMRTD
jgi:hypothetical protein